MAQNCLICGRKLVQVGDISFCPHCTFAMRAGGDKDAILDVEKG